MSLSAQPGRDYAVRPEKPFTNVTGLLPDKPFMLSLKKLFGKDEKFYDLLEASADEARTLRTFGAGPNERLACKLMIQAEEGTLRLRARSRSGASGSGAFA